MGILKKSKYLRIIKRSKRCDFVEFINSESAILAMKNVNQKEFGKRKNKLDYWKYKIELKFEEFEKMIKTRKLEEKIKEKIKVLAF